MEASPVRCRHINMSRLAVRDDSHVLLALAGVDSGEHKSSG